MRLPNNRAANVSFHSAFQLLALEITPGPAQHTDSVIESCRYPPLLANFRGKDIRFAALNRYVGSEATGKTTAMGVSAKF